MMKAIRHIIRHMKNGMKTTKTKDSGTKWHNFVLDPSKKKVAVTEFLRCELFNQFGNKHCSKCCYPKTGSI